MKLQTNIISGEQTTGYNIYATRNGKRQKINKKPVTLKEANQMESSLRRISSVNKKNNRSYSCCK